jgi:competence protein ComEA
MKKILAFSLILMLNFIFIPTAFFNASPGVVCAEEEMEAEVANKVNINTASVEELAALKGIGEKTAQAIVAYRGASGPFKTIEDIKNVKGIGDKKFEDLKDSITIE